MPPWLRKIALGAHVLVSVGWIGAVVAFLALSLAGLASRDLQIVRAAYLAMDLIARFVILPLCLASLLSGIACSLGTTWKLFRHYWVIAKLALTVPSTLLLILHLQPIGRLAHMAADGTLFGADVFSDRINVAGAAGAAALVLIAMTLLSVYKPRGMTRAGWRASFQLSSGSDAHRGL